VANRLFVYVFVSSSLFTNSNWFTFDGERGINDRLAASVPSSSPNSETSLETEETDDGKVIGTEDQMETVYLGNGAIEEAKDLVECTEQPNCSTEGEPLEDTEGMERHPDVVNGDTDVGTYEAASAAAESSPPSVEEAERKIVEPTCSSNFVNPVSEASPGPDVNGSEPTNMETSSEQVTHDTDLQQPTNEVATENVGATVQNVGATDPGVTKGNE
jgi:serine/threonine-protein phosphatase 6 regulatory subunit 3